MASRMARPPKFCCIKTRSSRGWPRQPNHDTAHVPPTVRAAAMVGRPSTDGNGDEPQKLVVRHRLFQHGHHPQAGGLAFDLRVMNAGDQ